MRALCRARKSKSQTLTSMANTGTCRTRECVGSGKTPRPASPLQVPPRQNDLTPCISSAGAIIYQVAVASQDLGRSVAGRAAISACVRSPPTGWSEIQTRFSVGELRKLRSSWIRCRERVVVARAVATDVDVASRPHPATSPTLGNCDELRTKICAPDAAG